MVLMPHFVSRAKERNIPFDMISECLGKGKKIVNERNIIYRNKYIDCFMSLQDGTGLTVKLTKNFERKIMKDAKKYGTSKRRLVEKYFKSLGYKI